MRFFFVLILLLPASVLTVMSQDKPEELARARQEKIETILQIQDRRTNHDSRLISFLSDPDDVVRSRAVFAYESIQDTTVISLLVERFQHDESPAVQFASACAIGQTAGLLSKAGRELLQQDIIWSRMEHSSAQGRMIEELGKFGTETALKDLISKFGESSLEPHDTALTMSIARFAIRGVTYPAATKYLVTKIINGRNLIWQDMYALQRIGLKSDVRQEIDKIAAIFQNSDTLIRLNLAVLLGKVRDETSCLDPLTKLAERDRAWEVRVAALKALGNFHLTKLESGLRVFRMAINDANPYIATTALASLGNSDLNLMDSSSAVQDLRGVITHAARNDGNGYPWQVQGEAATALAKLTGAAALAYLNPKESPYKTLRGQLLNAAGLTGAPEAEAILKGYIGNDEKLFYRAALEGLQSLSNKIATDTKLAAETRSAAVVALGSNDVAIVTTAASILGDSLFIAEASAGPLVEKLDKLRIPDDIEAMQEIVSTLGKLKAKKAVSRLERMLTLPDRSIVLAAAASLKAITGKDYDAKIALRFEPLYTDFDFAYLRSLPDTVHVKLETIRGDIMMDFYKNIAPFTVMNVLKLATQRGFYRGLTFHRIVPTFVVQGGDPRGDGWGGSGYAIRSEFSQLTYETGTLGIASAGKDTEGSQFFITQTPQPHLDGRYTIFGKVTSGMEAVDKLQLDDHMYDMKIVQ